MIISLLFSFLVYSKYYYSSLNWDAPLIDWVNSQQLGELVTCLGDGHDGIWNIVEQIANSEQRFEILDWFHLTENLYKVDALPKFLDKVKTHLWLGEVDFAIAELELLSSRPKNFIAYITKHRFRIPQYDLVHNAGFAVGSGAVESLGNFHKQSYL